MQGILPKEEIGAKRFLQEHPEYDGRGVVVAIFDTGVDPGAAGLQTTTDGRPKVIDMVDGSGSGDVDTSTVKEAEEGVLEGLSGRELHINPAWNNPTGKYHLGLKPAYELYPEGLVSRMKEERKKEWIEKQRQAVADARDSLARFEAKHPNPEGRDALKKKDLQNRVDQLEAMQKQYKDPGPVFDCIVFHDGGVWRAAVDTDEDGEFTDEKLLTNYRLEHEYGTFSEVDLLNFALNIYEEGNLLSIVVDCGGHGTHVAGIVAANYPDHPDMNGIAPGAQIVSVKIGDTRLGSRSTGTGEVRGLAAVIQNNCDLINMSYGGPTSNPNRGRLIELFSEMVNEHRVIWVASAGNSGPALSTVGSPGGTTSAILGIGAYVSPDMMRNAYSMREPVEEMPFTWSSRGPTFDGDLGVDLCAPGGAISPMPNWLLRRNQLANGTSMSSPNACGGIALLLSGLKEKGIPYSPQSVRRALENTARPVEGAEPWAQGHGLIQVDQAFAHLESSSLALPPNTRFEIHFPSRSHARGLYLREAHEVRTKSEWTATVEPKFPEDTPHRQMVEFELPIHFQATQPWVEHPAHLLLMNSSRPLEFTVDPTGLPPGAHYAEIQGTISGKPEEGILVRIPITIVIPETLQSSNVAAWGSRLSFRPGLIQRFFFTIPDNVQQAQLALKTGELDTDTSRRFVAAMTQVVPGKNFSHFGGREFITLKADEEKTVTFSIKPGRTLEIALAQYWSSLGATDLEAKLFLQGLDTVDGVVVLDGGEITSTVDLAASWSRIEAEPQAKLTKWRRTFRPSKQITRPLRGERDQLPQERIPYELVLQYEFNLPSKATIHPVPALSTEEAFEYLFESTLWQIFDANKQLVASGIDDDTASLVKGDYVLRWHARHDDPAALDKLKDQVLWMDQPLEKPISIKTFSDPQTALFGGGGFGTRLLEKGDSAEVILFMPQSSELPKEVSPGDWLLGNLAFSKEQGNEVRIRGRFTGELPLQYKIVTPPKDKPDPSNTANGKEEDLPPLKETLRDARIDRLTALRQKKKWDAYSDLSEKLLKQWPDHLPLRVEILKRYDDHDRKEHLDQVIETANAVLERIDTEALAQNLGKQIPDNDKEAKKERDKWEEKKKVLIDTLYRKGRAIAYRDARNETDTEDPDSEFESNFKELQKWADTTSKDHFLLHVRWHRRWDRYGSALALLNKHIEESPTDKQLIDKRIKMFDKLGLEHWKEWEKQWNRIRFRPEYLPF